MAHRKSHRPPLQDSWKKYLEIHAKFRETALEGDFKFANVAFQAAVLETIPFIFAGYLHSATGPRRRHLSFPKKRNRNR